MEFATQTVSLAGAEFEEAILYTTVCFGGSCSTLLRSPFRLRSSAMSTTSPLSAAEEDDAPA